MPCGMEDRPNGMACRTSVADVAEERRNVCGIRHLPDDKACRSGLAAEGEWFRTFYGIRSRDVRRDFGMVLDVEEVGDVRDNRLRFRA